MKALIYIFLVALFFSCGTSNKQVQSIKQAPKETKESLNLKAFPSQALLLSDLNFIGYLNYKQLSQLAPSKKVIQYLNQHYFLKDANAVYFTLNDIEKSQELLLFVKNFQFDLKQETSKKEKLFGNMLTHTLTTNNQSFGGINFSEDALYGDTALIKELFQIKHQKQKPISQERYQLFTESPFLKDNQLFKLIFLPNAKYHKKLQELAKNQKMLKPLLSNLKYVMLSLNIVKKEQVKATLTLRTSQEVTNTIYKLVQAQKTLFLTMKDTPFTKFQSKETKEKTKLLKALEIKKLTEDTLQFTLQKELKKSTLETIFTLVKKYIKEGQ